MASTIFTKHGNPVTPVPSMQLTELFKRSSEEFLLPLAMLTEAAGFSLSIVIRYALGLSARDGRSFALVSESVEGCVALAGVRQLVNAGVDAGIILLEQPQNKIPWYEESLSVLDKQGIPLILLEPIVDTEFETLLGTCHNMILGVGEDAQSPVLPKACEMMNEIATPCHSVSLPPGISRTTNTVQPWALFSSSTMALGVPDTTQEKFLDYLGRWYVADCSLPKPLYDSLGIEAATFFSEQPVIEIIKKSSE